MLSLQAKQCHTRARSPTAGDNEEPLPSLHHLYLHLYFYLYLYLCLYLFCICICICVFIRICICFVSEFVSAFASVFASEIASVFASVLYHGQDHPFFHHYQGSIDFNTANIHRTVGMYFLISTGNSGDIE